jgi:8-oxo-dGTP pyrophosphatase MutT (NUDIX family)
LIPPAGPTPRWGAIEAAARRATRRLPFEIDGRTVGSVALAHLDALRTWPHWIELRADRVALKGPADERDAAFATMNAALRAAGLIVAWRDEPFALFTPDGSTTLAVIERAAARFWGTLTLGAHCNGYVAGTDGRPEKIWIARRSMSKATDPGKFDNLIGGGVPFGQSPFEALVREGFEEAGLDAERMRTASPGGQWLLNRDVPEGRQLERLHVFDLPLPPGLRPQNQDGEVASIELLPLAEAAALAADGDAMTVDAALVTLDFLLRYRLLPAAEAAAAEQRIGAAGLRAA